VGGGAGDAGIKKKMPTKEKMDNITAATSGINPRSWSVKTKSGLTLHATLDGSSDVFDAFFVGYDKAFILPSEKEGRDGFLRCFDLNHGAAYKRLSAQYGTYREVCAIAEDSETGLPIGGANFLGMPLTSRSGSHVVTANLNYIYINEGARGKGYLGRLFASVRELIADLFPKEAEETCVLVFIEQNDPFRMSEEDYRRDSEFTGLDQFDRLRIWAKLGARVVDFPYEQPPLSPEQDADDTLIYSVLGAQKDSLGSEILEGHLRRFFGVSVLKGADLAAEPSAHSQLELLRAKIAAAEDVPLLNPDSLLSRIQDCASASRLLAEQPQSFRSAVRVWISRDMPHRRSRWFGS
jgi:hypothetical protein